MTSTPPGTPVRVYPGAIDDEISAYDTVIVAPRAYLPGSMFGTRVSVKVKGDSIAIAHIVPLDPNPASSCLIGSDSANHSSRRSSPAGEQFTTAGKLDR